MRRAFLLVAMSSLGAGCSLLAPLSHLSDDWPSDVPDTGAASEDADPGDTGARHDAEGGTVAGDGAGGSTTGTNAVCASDCLGGACLDGRCQPVDVHTGQGRPLGLTVNDQKVYWVNAGSDVGAPAGVYRSFRAGGTVTTVVDAATAGSTPFDVAVDDTSVYWTDAAQNAVYRTSKLSPAGRTQVTAGDGRTAFLSVTSGWVLVTDYRTDAPTLGGVSRSLSGATSSNGSGLTVLYPGHPLASGVCGVGGDVYWASRTTGVVRVGTTGGDGTSPSTVVLTAGEPVSGIAVADGTLYFLAGGRRLRRAPLADPSKVETMWESPVDVGPGDVAVDDEAVYFSEPALGRVRRLTR